QNDHECVTIEDAKVRIECGMNVYIREGSAVRNVEAIISGLVEYNKNAEINGAKKLPIDNFAFCTDDKHLSTIYREGHIDRNVILAVSLGLPLLDAVKMASTSPARFYNLQDRGSIEIGKIADIALLESEINPKVSMVFKRGVLACDILKNDGISTKNLQNNLQIDTTRQDETDDYIN
ncbi:MAG: amidohydrolase family protein, partial [Clostridia bacterium]